MPRAAANPAAWAPRRRRSRSRACPARCSTSATAAAQLGVVGDGGGDVEGEPADPGAGGFFAGGLQGAVAVVAVALGLVPAGAGGPGAADLSGGDLGFDLGCRLVGRVGLIQPAHPPRVRAGRHQRGQDRGVDGLAGASRNAQLTETPLSWR